MPTLDEQWQDMCDEFRKKQDAYADCLKGLYRSGRVVSQERLAECERLRQEVADHRRRMDNFLGKNP